MQYRTDPKSGNQLSILGFGCMRFAGNSMVNSFLPKKKVDEDKIEKLIVEAVESGVNYFDTAYIYTGSEVLLGKILAKNKLREKVYIATKLPVIMLRKEEEIDKFFNTELERLQTDYVDYYLMHMLPDVDAWNRLKNWGIEDWIKKQKEAGRIKQLGFSFHGSQSAFLDILNAYDWDFCQIQYNYSDENYQAGVTGLKAAAEKGIPVMIMEPMLGGRLAWGLPEKAKDRFKAADPDSTPVTWALNWLYNQPEVTVVLSGMNEFEQLRENVAIASKAEAGMLGDAEMQVFADVKQIFNDSYKVHCTGCHYCMPCPAGVNIPTCFSAYNAYHSINKSTGTTQYMMSTIMGKKNSFASLCKECGLCETHCPQHLPIRQHLKDVAKTMETPMFKAAKVGMGVVRKIKGEA